MEIHAFSMKGDAGEAGAMVFEFILSHSGWRLRADMLQRDGSWHSGQRSACGNLVQCRHTGSDNLSCDEAGTGLPALRFLHADDPYYGAQQDQLVQCAREHAEQGHRRLKGREAFQAWAAARVGGAAKFRQEYLGRRGWSGRSSEYSAPARAATRTGKRRRHYTWPGCSSGVSGWNTRTYGLPADRPGHCMRQHGPGPR